MRMKAGTLCGLLLAALFAVSIPSTTVQAAELPPELWLGGKGTGVNMVQGSDVTYLESDASTEITTTEPASWAARYDGAGTLTLRNGTFQSSGTDNFDGAIYGSGDLTIQLDGDVTLSSSNHHCLLLYPGNLTITGSGKLTTTDGDIYVLDSVKIQGGTLDIYGGLGIASFGSSGITMSGGKVTTRANWGIYSLNGPFTMTGGALTAIGGCSAIYALGMELSSDLYDHVGVSMKKTGADVTAWDKTSPLYADDYVPGEFLSYLYVDIGNSSYSSDSGYTMLEGQGENWAEDSEGNMTFRANGEFEKFTGVKVDGSLIDPVNYTAASGSTIITLKNEYLKTLSSGAHTISIVYTDGEAVANFSIGQQDAGSGSSSGSGGASRPDVYAQGETYGEVRVEKSGTGATVIRGDGTKVETIVHPYISAPSRQTTQAAGVYAFDLTLVDAYTDYSFVTLKKGPVNVTFYVPGVAWDTSVVVRQWIGDRYVDLPVTTGSGSVTATFDTLSTSTVMILVGPQGINAGATAAPAAGKVSPKTGEGSGASLAAAIALLSLTGMGICERKRRAAR